MELASPTFNRTPTFLDPYLGLDLQGRGLYGSDADWADSYFAHDSASLWWTEGALSNAYNIDVTLQDPALSVGGSSHSWPHDFYHATITNSLFAEGYGYPLSMEAGGWNFATNHFPVGNNPPFAFGLRPTPPQGLIPIASVVTPNFLDLRHVTSQSSPASLNGIGFQMTVTLPPPAEAESGAPQATEKLLANQFADSSWLSIGITVTNPVNFVSLEAEFSSAPGAQGYLSVYWNTNSIGFVDERIALSGLQEYTFSLPSVVTNGVFALGFQLNTFTNIASSITVTNVKTGFAGLTVPVSLAESINHNGVPVLTLTGASGYYYLLQSSTNLVDWVPAATLINTNGSVEFSPPEGTNFTQRFFRAISP